MNALAAARKLRENSRRAPNGCLEWTGASDGDGYGFVRIDERQHRAHRVAWELANDGPPPRHLMVRHRCDNPPCVEGSHLELGTAADNARDREERGRGSDRRGEKCPTARLTWPQVVEIRRRLAEGRSHQSLAEQFGVSRKAISKIFHGETWKP